MVSRVISRFICDKRATWRLEGEKNGKLYVFFRRIKACSLLLYHLHDYRLYFQELRKQWRESGPEEMTETADEQEAILREGVGLKLELSREELRQKAAGEGKELEPDDDAVSLLAALQQHQEQEAEYLLRDLAVKVRNRVFGESSLYSLLLMQTLVKTAPTIQSVDESKVKAFEKFTWLWFF